MSGHGNAHENDERFLALESRILYQDQTIDDLNAVVTRQQDQVDQLTADVRKLKALVESMPTEGIDAGEEPAPPHY
jgi:SlyX protein